MPTQGVYSVGPTAGTYANFGAAISDIGGQLTGDLTFEAIEDFAEPLVVSFNGVDLNGHTLKLTSAGTGHSHNGDPDSGRVISWSFGTVLFFLKNPLVNSAAGSRVEIADLNLRSLNTNNETALALSASTTPNDVTCEVHDVIIDYRTVTSVVGDSSVDIKMSGAHTAEVYNCLIINHGSNIGDGAFVVSASGVNGTFENCGVVGTRGNSRGFLFAGTYTGTVRNCVAIQCAGSGFSGQASATGYSNMSDDGTCVDASWSTGSGNYPNIVPADEFQSVDPSNAAFMKPTPTGTACRFGTAVSIAGNDHSATLSVPRPQLTLYAIGWQEYDGPPIILVQPISDMVALSASASFSVSAVFVVGYQWQSKPSGSISWSDVVGETLSSYTTDPTILADHYTRVRCILAGYAGQLTTSGGAYILIEGQPVISEPPDRPSASIRSIVDRTITITVTGIADIFRAELLKLDSSVATFDEISGVGNLTILVPQRGMKYTLVVVAGNAASPISWSLPGLSLSIVIPPLSSESEEPGIGFSPEPSTAVQEAGPLGAGLSFPFRFSSTTGAPQVSIGADHVVDGMQQILLTRISERPIRREFGSAIAGRLFAPDVQIGPDISASIQMALANFERRSEVTRVVFRRDRVHGKIFADVKYRIYRTHQDGNLVYPFAMEV